MNWKELKEKQKRVDDWDRDRGFDIPKDKISYGLRTEIKKQYRPDRIQRGKFETKDRIISFEKINQPKFDEIRNWINNGADDIWMRQQGASINRINQVRKNMSIKRLQNW